MSYLLIHRGPGGRVGAHPTVFDDVDDAARATTQYVRDDYAAAVTFASEFATMLPGSVAEHDSGYSFRIIKADFTADERPVPITPGLKVHINDQWDGIVEPTQFMFTGLMDPGSRFHDGWYLVYKNGKPHNKYNGERMHATMVAV